MLNAVRAWVSSIESDASQAASRDLSDRREEFEDVDFQCAFCEA